MEQVFRLTFNKPSGRAFFEGMTGIRVSLEGGVKFKPVATFRQHNDAVAIALSERGDRGGFEAEIEGNKGADLLKMLQRLSTPRQPFFLLRKDADGWLNLQHYPKDNNPPKFEPHVRFWPPRDEETPRQRRARLRREMKAEAIQQMPKDPALAFSKRILEAHKVLVAYQGARRIGRPPREVNEAQMIMDGFSDLVRKVRPSLVLEETVDMRLLEQVHEHLGSLINASKYGAPVEDVPAKTPSIKTTGEPKPRAKVAPKTRTTRLKSGKVASKPRGRAKALLKTGEQRVASEEFQTEEGSLPLAVEPQNANGEIRDTVYVRDEHAQVDFSDLTPEEQSARLAEEAQRRMGFKPRRVRATA